MLGSPPNQARRRALPLVLLAALLVAVPAAPAGAAPENLQPPPTKPAPSPPPGATPKVLPGSRLPGAGAFEGPVTTVGVNDVKLGYRQFGRGPDLVMITGDTAPMSLWMPYLLKPLARHFTVTIFDNRGVGYATDDLSRPLTVPLMAIDTGDLIDVLGLEHPTVVGWSMGGEIGLTLAERRPNLLGALVTTGGDAGSAQTIPPPPGLVAELADPEAGAEVFLRLLFPVSPAGEAATGFTAAAK